MLPLIHSYSLRLSQVRKFGEVARDAGGLQESTPTGCELEIFSLRGCWKGEASAVVRFEELTVRKRYVPRTNDPFRCAAETEGGDIMKRYVPNC